MLLIENYARTTTHTYIVSPFSLQKQAMADIKDDAKIKICKKTLALKKLGPFVQCNLIQKIIHSLVVMLQPV